MQNRNEPKNDDKNICIKCGMCCDGTLFSWATIFEGETINSNLEMKIIQTGLGKRAFTLPCRYLKDCTCLIYYSSILPKPLICSRFKCKLLKRFENKEISYQDSLKIINDSKTLISTFNTEINAYFPDLVSEPISVKLNKLIEKHNDSLSQVEFRKKYVKVLLDRIILIKKFNKYFIKMLP